MERKRELVIIIKEGTDRSMIQGPIKLEPGIQSSVGIKWLNEDCPYSVEDGAVEIFENTDSLTGEQIMRTVEKLLPIALKEADANNYKYELHRHE